MAYKVNTKLLRSQFEQMTLAYRACMKACDNNDHKHAVSLQLAAVEAGQAFEDQLLKELERMRTGAPKKTWAP